MDTALFRPVLVAPIRDVRQRIAPPVFRGREPHTLTTPGSTAARFQVVEE